MLIINYDKDPISTFGYGGLNDMKASSKEVSLDMWLEEYVFPCWVAHLFVHALKLCDSLC